VKIHSFRLVALAGALALSAAVLSPAHAQSNKNKTSVLPLVAGPVIAGALFPATSTFSWTTIGMKTWSFPWAHGPGKFGFFTGNYVPQGLNATGQYVHNVVNPKYFGETLHISSPHQSSGTHSTSAKYKQQHSRSSKNVGKAVVGCIFGSALGAITSAVRKGHAMGRPTKWYPQAEFEKLQKAGYWKASELTIDEANTAVALCGLGSFTLHWPQQPI
jgi:hypothetical protein